MHDPDVQPFSVPWTDAEPAQRARATLQYHWRSWGTWQPMQWSLDLVTVLDGRVVGTQGLTACEFATLRQVSTGSWLGRAFHGRGIGTEMRAAALHLAFAGLDAEYAVSDAYEYNSASLGVSRKLGYADDGIERHVVRGRPVVLRRLRLHRDGWAAHRTVPVEVHGLEPCRALFGLTV